MPPSHLDYGDESGVDGTITPHQLLDSCDSNNQNDGATPRAKPEQAQEAQIRVRPKQFTRSMFTIEEESLDDRDDRSMLSFKSPNGDDGSADGMGGTPRLDRKQSGSWRDGALDEVLEDTNDLKKRTPDQLSEVKTEKLTQMNNVKMDFDSDRSAPDQNTSPGQNYY